MFYYKKNLQDVPLNQVQLLFQRIRIHSFILLKLSDNFTYKWILYKNIKRTGNSKLYFDYLLVSGWLNHPQLPPTQTHTHRHTVINAATHIAQSRVCGIDSGVEAAARLLIRAEVPRGLV